MLASLLHPNTKAMLQAWRRLSARQPAISTPDEPLVEDHTSLIGRLFVLHEIEPRCWTFRTAGEDLSKLLGRELVEQEFLSLWTGPDRTMMSGLLDSIATRGRPGIVRARGETMVGRRVETEIALAPLQRSGDKTPRMLGLYQSLGGEAMLGGRPIWRHCITTISAPDAPSGRTALRLVASNDRA